MVSHLGGLGWSQLLLPLAALSVCILPLGAYMAKVYRNQTTALTQCLGWAETLIYKVAGIDSSQEMDWRTYALATLTLSSLGFVALYVLLVAQAVLPGNPAHLPGLAPDKAFIVAVSYVTGTSLVPPAFVGALSPLTRTAGLTAQTFISAAVGMSVFMAISRGLSGRHHGRVGNFWVDVVRTIIYVLVPMSFLLVSLVATSGVGEAIDVFARTHLAAAPGAMPDTAEETLRLITTRGGNLINAVSTQTAATTPTAGLVNFLSALLIPCALCYTFGIIVDDRRQAIVALAAAAFGTVVWFGHPTGSQTATAVLSGNTGLLFVLIAGLILTTAGLSWLRGRKARYLGRQLSPFEILMAATACLVPCTLVLLSDALHHGEQVAESLTPPAIYALLSLAVLCGRFWVMIPALAMAGSLSGKPPSEAEA